MKTLIFCALGLFTCATSAASPAAAGANELRDRYMKERAACEEKAVADRKNCLREAGAALHEARRGTLGRENAEYEKNRFARCGYHKDAEERDYCERRMRGEGTVTGSIEGGGLLRELKVIVPAQ